MLNNTTITRNLNDFDQETENIYEALAIISKRANQIASKEKEELNAKLLEFASTSDSLEEVFENREQIEISRYYERQPKPTLKAVEEFLSDNTYFRNPAKEKKK